MAFPSRVACSLYLEARLRGPGPLGIMTAMWLPPNSLLILCRFVSNSTAKECAMLKPIPVLAVGEGQLLLQSQEFVERMLEICQKMRLGALIIFPIV